MQLQQRRYLYSGRSTALAGHGIPHQNRCRVGCGHDFRLCSNRAVVQSDSDARHGDNLHCRVAVLFIEPELPTRLQVQGHTRRRRPNAISARCDAAATKPLQRHPDGRSTERRAGPSRVKPSGWLIPILRLSSKQAAYLSGGLFVDLRKLMWLPDQLRVARKNLSGY